MNLINESYILIMPHLLCLSNLILIFSVFIATQVVNVCCIVKLSWCLP